MRFFKIKNLLVKLFGVGRTPTSNVVEVAAEAEEDTNYVAVVSASDKTRGFSIDSEDGYKWANYVYDGEDGDTQYFASGNSERDILIMQSGGRVALNPPTLLTNIEILRFVQTGTNTYATITTEYPHRLANNTSITISGATNEKFNGAFIVSAVSTMTFRITDVPVGAVTEEPTAATIVQIFTIPAAFTVMPQYFDSVYAFDKSLDTGAGEGYTNITTEMRTSVGASVVLPSTTGSYLYIGKKYPWRATAVNISTPSAGSTAIVVEYSTESGWVPLSVSTTSGQSLVDTTSRLRNDGNISWDLKSFKSLWKQQILQVNPAPHYTENLYWIRISLVGTVTTAPQAFAIGNHGIDRLAVFAQSGDNNPVFKIDSLGRVGFLPAELDADYKLGTLSGVGASKFEVVSEDGTRSDFVYYLANNDTGSNPAIVFARSGGTVATKTAITNGMTLGGMVFVGYNGTTFTQVAKIIAASSADATAAGNRTASGLDFFTRAEQNESSQQRMRIDKNGKVGIGVVPAHGLLDLAGTLAFRNLPIATRPISITPVAGGSIDVGSHSWKVSYTSSAGEAIPSTASSAVTIVSGSQSVTMDIPLGPASTTSRKIYRTVAGNTGNWKLVGSVLNNTSTTFTDSVADSALGADAPSTDASLVGNISVGSILAMVLSSNGNVNVPVSLTVNNSPVIAGSTGVTDNAILRADGTGGATAQASALSIADTVSPLSCTGVASTDIITATGHIFTANQVVYFPALTGGSGLTAKTTPYYVRDISGDTFKVSASSGGAAVNFTTDISAGTVVAVQASVTAENISPDTDSSTVITTKGTGAFIVGKKPDGTASGGNKRGDIAVDIQPGGSSAATKIASGYGAVAIGGSATASGSRSVAIGNNVTATGNFSVCLGGYNSSASGAVSVAMGRDALADRAGARAFCSHTNSSQGHRQELQFFMSKTTSSDTAAEMLTDEYTPAARITIPSGKVMGGIVCVTGSKSDGTKVALYTRSFLIKNVGGTTTLVNTATIGTDYEDDATTALTIEGNDTNDALRVLVQGVTGETWRWTAWVHCTEHFYGT